MESEQLGGLANAGQRNTKAEWIVRDVWCAVRLAMRTLCGLCARWKICEKAASIELQCALEEQFVLLLKNSSLLKQLSVVKRLRERRCARCV